MAQKKYVSLIRLSNFLDNIKTHYSQIGHKHTISDLTDYKIDSALDSNSTNPVQNKVLENEFEEISQAMLALDSAIDSKADSDHTHTIANVSGLQSALDGKADSSHTHSISNVTNLQSSLDAKVPTTRTINGKALSSDITLSASDVGADASGSADAALTSANTYTDTKINDLVNGAPTTLDTIKEVADAIEAHREVTDALDAAIGTKANASDLTSHTGNKSNPHEVTKSQVGLGNVPNVATNDQTPTYSDTTTFATLSSGEKLSVAFPKIKLAITNLINHINNKSNPHVVTKSQVGLGNVDNTSDADKPISTATQTALDAIDSAKAPVANGQYAITTAGTGSAYTATVPSITTLTVGASFIMIPHVVSTSTAPTLNVNGLGAKTIKRRLSSIATSLQSGYSNSWLAKDKPFRVVYDGTCWIVEGQTKPAAADMYGLSASITELNYCEGVTSSIQTQLDSKASSSHNHSASDITSGVMDASRLPDASETADGIVNTSSQSFAGSKTFVDKVNMDSGLSSGGNISTSTANTNDIGSNLKPFRNTYTKNLYIYPQSVSGSAIDYGKFEANVEGTTSTNGISLLTVGNLMASGTNGNARGRIKVYNKNKGSVTIETSHTSDIGYYLNLPDSSGTLATTDDLSTLTNSQTITSEEYEALGTSGRSANTLYMVTDANEVTSIEEGGTNATTASDARTNLGFTYGTVVPTDAPETGEGSVCFVKDDGTPLSLEEGGTGAVTVEGVHANLGTADYIVEQGKGGNWYYRKWNSGVVELWGSFTQTSTAYAKNSFVVGSVSLTGYPFTITEPIAQATGRRISTGIGLINYDYERTDYWSGIMIAPEASYASGVTESMSYYVHVFAKWK